jgi:hypothetical protein
MEVSYRWNLDSELTNSSMADYRQGVFVFEEVDEQGMSIENETAKRISIEIGGPFCRMRLKQYTEEDVKRIVCWFAIEYGLKKGKDKVVIGRPGKTNNVGKACFPEPNKISNIGPNLCKIEIPDSKNKIGFLSEQE